METTTFTDIKLYRFTDEDGTLKFTEIKKGPLFQADLNSEDTFIIDNGANGNFCQPTNSIVDDNNFCETGMFVWVGKKATEQERTKAIRNGQSFAKKTEYPPNISVVRVLDGDESAEFKALFLDWKVRDQAIYSVR
jgi:hypothetical protein